jgi:outer membrane immunogenic protein
MKNAAIGIAAVAALIGTPALAADMAVKAPPPSPAPVYSWIGFYVGGNIGGSWGNADGNVAGSMTHTEVFPTGLPYPASFASDRKQDVNGIIGGGQIGYNFQFSPRWVWGIEADIQGSSQHGKGTFADPFSGFACDGFAPPNCAVPSTLTGTAVGGLEAKIDWFGTVRGRLGWLVTDQTLLYVTGGLAYGQVSVSGNLNVSASTFGTTWTPVTSVFAASQTNIGFALGGGIEGKFAAWLPPNWSWKLEYLYVDLGSFDASVPFTSTSGPPGIAPGAFSNLNGTMTIHTRFTDNIVRVGLNYKFN